MHLATVTRHFASNAMGRHVCTYLYVVFTTCSPTNATNAISKLRHVSLYLRVYYFDLLSVSLCSLSEALRFEIYLSILRAISMNLKRERIDNGV
jgi:hypothetical protein